MKITDNKNIYDYVNLLTQQKLLINLTKELEYRNNIKKQITRQITQQRGGAKINLDSLDILVQKFGSIDKSRINRKLTDLNKSINNLNSLVKNVNLGADFSELNLDRIINDSATFITKFNTSGQVIKENIKMKLPNFALDSEYQKNNAENINTLEKIIDEYINHMTRIQQFKPEEITGEKITEIVRLKEQLKIICDQISKSLNNIDLMGKYRAIEELDFLNIGIGSENERLDVGDKNKIFIEPNDINGLESIFKSVFDSDSEEQKEFDKLKHNGDLLQVKNFLNSKIDLGLCVGDVEKRVFNSFLKEELVKMPEHKLSVDITNEILHPTDIFTLKGGSQDLEQLIKLFNDLKKLKSVCENYNKKIIHNVRNYNYESLKMMYHNIFMIGVFNNVFVLDNYMEYTHLNGGLVNFYFNIVSNIREKLSKGYVSKELIYWKKYHSLNLEILYKVLLKMKEIYTDHTYLKNYVNIKLSGENIRYGCLILNFLKSQLVDYYQNSEASITIYARINDWGTIPTTKLFTREGTDILKVNPSACEIELGEPNLKSYLDNIVLAKRKDCREGQACSPSAETKYKFNSVYDEHQTNDTLSTFMGLKLNISKGINTGLITYGYSGTGKTYTLSGSSAKKTSGLLQDALKVDGVSEVSFRIYELYGLGLQYPYYWTEGTDKIYHNIYHYDIEISGNVFNIKNVYEIPSSQFSDYTKISSDLGKDIRLTNGTTQNISFVKISSENLQEVMSNFESLVTAIDDIRKSEKRIRETPNNPESSRSLIVYDFDLKVKIVNELKKTNFLIIDLPGKESIEKTYIDKYYNLFLYYKTNSSIKDEFNPYQLGITNYPEYIKMLLLATSLQPLLIPVIDPDGFKEGVDNSIKKGKQSQINELIKIANDYYFNSERLTVSNIFKVSIENNKLKILREKLLLTHGTDNNFSIPNYGIFFINAIIQNNNFSVLSDIIEHVINKRINNVINDINNTRTYDKLMEQFKTVKPNIKNKITVETTSVQFGEEVEKLFKNINPKKYDELKSISTIDLTKEILLNLIKYDYYLTPYEGLYINENIVGIIKYCEIRKGATVSVKPQNSDLIFENQRDIVRGLILKKDIDDNSQKNVNTKLNLGYDTINKIYTKCLDSTSSSCDETKTVKIYPITETIVSPLSYKLNLDSVNKMYKTFLSFYEPDNIYNFDKPIIETILSHYLEINDGQINPLITDFKIFYLVSNNSLEIKCTSQENLLHLTREFIANISKTD